MAEISLDNGATFLSAIEAMDLIEEYALWNKVVKAMNKKLVDQIRNDLSHLTPLRLLERYLELSEKDLIIRNN